LRASGR